MKKVSVVIPARNEETNIGLLLDDLLCVENNLSGYQFENIVIDDKSIDRTADIALAKSCKVIQNNGRNGKGNALKLGFSQAEGDYIIMMDADCSHRPEDISAFLSQLERKAGLVIGSRILGGSEEYTRIRAFGNIFLTWVFGFLMGRYLSDALNGFKAFERRLITECQYVANDFEIEIELIANALSIGMTIVEIPSHERVRLSGVAKSRVVKHGFKFFTMILRQWMKKKSASKPGNIVGNSEQEWLENMKRLNKYNSWLFSYLNNYIGEVVWEAGAGIGTYSQYMLHAKSLILSDIEENYLIMLKEQFANQNNIIVKKIDLVTDDYKKLQGYKIDTVVCINVLEHIELDIKALENIYKVLVPGGRLLLVVPNHQFLFGSLDKFANHYRRYSRRQLSVDLLKIGFKIENIYIFNLLATINWFFNAKVLQKRIISYDSLVVCERLVPVAKVIDRINPFLIGANIIFIAKK